MEYGWLVKIAHIVLGMVPGSGSIRYLDHILFFLAGAGLVLAENGTGGNAE